MNDDKSRLANDVLSISRDELLSPHVDDLLKRQKSLRGEGGVSRGRRAWYYQNWFVLMLVGALGAFIAWAVIEPYFGDSAYLQGKIQRIERAAVGQKTISDNGEEVPVDRPVLGMLELQGTEIWILRGTRIQEDGETRSLKNLGKLEVDQTIGVYVESLRGASDAGMGIFLVIDPPSLAEQTPSVSQQNARTAAAAILLFPLVAGFVGLCIGAVDGAICRLPRRAFLAGAVGLLVGFIGGFISSILATLAYVPMHHLAMYLRGDGGGALTSFGFTMQMIGRGLAWGLAGTAMGLGQGIALRSTRLFLYGLLGGVIGGLLGGLLFDPIDIVLLGIDKPDAAWSRMIGLIVVGGTVGAMIGIVELLARDAWLRMVEGPLAGKEFLIFKDRMMIGASPRSDIYLFNDPMVADHHASLRSAGEECDLECVNANAPIEINGHPCQRGRLHSGDRITIGRTSFVFEKRRR